MGNLYPQITTTDDGTAYAARRHMGDAVGPFPTRKAAWLWLVDNRYMTRAQLPVRFESMFQRDHTAGPQSSQGVTADGHRNHWGECTCGWSSKTVSADWQTAANDADAHLVDVFNGTRTASRSMRSCKVWEAR